MEVQTPRYFHLPLGGHHVSITCKIGNLLSSLASMEVYINTVFTLWDVWGLLNITLTWVKFA